MLDTFEVRLHSHFGHETEIEDFFHERNVYALREMLAYYTKIAFSPENVLAMIAIVDFERFPSMSKLNFIFGYFIEESSKYTINISASQRRDLLNGRGRLLNAGGFGSRVSGGRLVRAPRNVSTTPPPPASFFRDTRLHEHLLVDIGEVYERFRDEFLHENHGFTYVRHLDVAGNTVVQEVKNFLVKMLHAGFIVSPKIMRLDS